MNINGFVTQFNLCIAHKDYIAIYLCLTLFRLCLIIFFFFSQFNANFMFIIVSEGTSWFLFDLDALTLLFAPFLVLEFSCFDDV